jgi:hypothetical protein
MAAVKTEGTSVLTLQAVAASAVVVSASIDVSTKLGGIVNLFFARTTLTAPAAGVTFRIEGLAVASGAAGDWVPLAQYTTGIAQCNAGTAIANSSTSGAVQTVTSGGASITAGQSFYIKDGTLANSEWAYCLSSAATTITAQQTIAASHTTGNCYNQAERVSVPVDLTALSHLRVVADGSQHNQAFDTKVLLNTFDSA